MYEAVDIMTANYSVPTKNAKLFIAVNLLRQFQNPTSFQNVLICVFSDK